MIWSILHRCVRVGPSLSQYVLQTEHKWFNTNDRYFLIALYMFVFFNISILSVFNEIDFIFEQAFSFASIALHTQYKRYVCTFRFLLYKTIYRPFFVHLTRHFNHFAFHNMKLSSPEILRPGTFLLLISTQNCFIIFDNSRVWIHANWLRHTQKTCAIHEIAAVMYSRSDHHDTL